MFSDFYKLAESPFKLTPDHRYFFQSSVHKKALGYLVYGIQQGEGFVVITGEVGAGKTTLAAHLLSTLNEAEFVTAHVVTTQIGGDDMLRLIAAQFGLDVEGKSKSALLRALERYFHDVQRSGRRALIILDECQNFTLEALEELRMLSNLMEDGRALVQSMMLGQPQFRTNLNQTDYDQLRQRIIASYHLSTLDRKETEAYIKHRLKVAGWRKDPSFSAGAFDRIFHYTWGVPRLTNLLCGRLLLYGMLEEKHKLDARAVDLVAEDMSRESASVLPGARESSEPDDMAITNQ